MRRIFLYLGMVIGIFVLLVGNVQPIRAAASDFCLCTDNLERITNENYKEMADTLRVGYFCKEKVPQDKCTVEGINSIYGETYERCTNDFANETTCTDTYAKWKLDFKAKLQASESAVKGLQSTKNPFIPDCAFANELTSECRDISIFLILAINISRYLFTIIGGLSLLMFVYGGFTLIISQGSSEKVQQGKNIMVAVVIGLLIAFGGYLLVDFLGQSLGVQQVFRLL